MKQEVRMDKSNDHIIEPLFTNIKIDAKRFEPYLDDPDLTQAEREELLETIYAIVLSFVDLGFGIHPIQQACEQNDIYSEIATLDLMDLLESMPNTKDDDVEEMVKSKNNPIQQSFEEGTTL